MSFNNPTSESLNAGLSSAAGSILLRLLKAPIPTDKLEIVFTDLVEANFDGYSPAVVGNLDETDESETDVGELLSNTVEFIGGDNVTAQPIFGYVFTIQKTGEPIGIIDAEEFSSPIVMDTPGQSIPVEVRVSATTADI